MFFWLQTLDKLARFLAAAVVSAEAAKASRGAAVAPAQGSVRNAQQSSVSSSGWDWSALHGVDWKHLALGLAVITSGVAAYNAYGGAGGGGDGSGSGRGDGSGSGSGSGRGDGSGSGSGDIAFPGADAWNVSDTYTCFFACFAGV